METEIKIVLKEVDKMPEVKVIKNELSELQKIVGGSIEAVPFHFGDIESENIVYLVCNKNGKLKKLQKNFYWSENKDCIFGDVFFVAGNFDGDLVSLSHEQIVKIINYLFFAALYVLSD